MARELLIRDELKGLKPTTRVMAHNPTGLFIKTIKESCLIKRK